MRLIGEVYIYLERERNIYIYIYRIVLREWGLWVPTAPIEGWRAMHNGKCMHLCEWCNGERIYAIGRIPDVKEWVCLKHMESFWHRVCAVASALREVDRDTGMADTEMSDTEFPDTEFPIQDSVSVPWTLLTGILEKARRYDALRSHCPDCGRLTTKDLETPRELECIRCGAVECPFTNPMHFMKDGCPSCDSPAHQ